MGALLFTDLTDTSLPPCDMADLLDRASHVTVQLCGKHTNHPGNAMLRGIIFAGVRYNDKGAACSCADLTLYKFGDEAYTRCTEHGLQSIGHLRREIANGSRK